MIRKVVEVATDGYLEYEVSKERISATRVQEVDSYYEENQRLRDNIGKSAVRRWAIPIAQIPYSVYLKLIAANPTLKHGDAETVSKEWIKLLNTGALEQLRTVRRNLIPESMNPDKGSILPPWGYRNAGEDVQE